MPIARSILIGVAWAGAGIGTRLFQLVTGRQREGSGFGCARGRTGMPPIVDGYMHGKIRLDEPVAQRLKLQDIHEDLVPMKCGESIRSAVVY
jgi:S-(hydroxymethyl)glutathione dehydrogenase / alcohol dehydrogenase